MRATQAAVAGLWLALAGCRSSMPDSLRAPGASTAPQVAPGPALSVSEAAPTDDAGGPAENQLTFSKDDYAAALRQARQRGLALVVDAWAPWCHTCLSMKHYVFTDPALAPLAERAVFVALDTDRPENAAFVERFPISVWPTFIVIDPRTERLVGLWPGAASALEFQRFVIESVAVIEALHKDQLAENSPLGKLIDAGVAKLAGDHAHAADLYAEAVRSSPADWSRRSEALLGWIESLNRAGKHAECARVGEQYLNDVQGAATPIDFIRYHAGCAFELKSAAERSRVLAADLRRLSALIENPSPQASVDDRADTLDLLASIHARRGERDEARRADERRLALLEEAARAAPSPAVAATHDYLRARAYVALGRPEQAVELLEARARELPDSYEPPARLAAVLHELGRQDAALAAADRAIGRAYGPRRLRYLALKARIQEKLGDRAGQIATLQAEVAGHEALGTDAARAGLEDARRRLEAAKRGASK